MEQGARVAAVVVTYNRAKQLVRCLDALLGQAGAQCDSILVIDNGSTDDTPTVIDPYLSKGVKYFNVGFNSGSAGGFHLGVYEAAMLGYEYIWVMDDDVVPAADALKALLDADDALNGNWGFLSSVSYWTDGTICKPNIQKKGLFSFVKGDDYSQELAKVKIASMASLMLKRDVVREVGLPIADYYIYTDDYEYTGRISDRYPCYMVTKSHVTHEMKKNEKVNLVKDTSDRLWRYRYLYRNDVHFYRRYGLAGWSYIIAKAMYTTANVVLHEREDVGGKLKTLYSSLYEGFHFNPETVFVKDASSHNLVRPA